MEALCYQFENAEIVAVNERVVISDAFDSSVASNHFPEDLGARVQEFR